MQQSFSQQQKLPLPSLLLKKSTANAAAAVAAATASNSTTTIIKTTTRTTAETIKPTTTTKPEPTNAISSTDSRRCIFDCDDNSVVLCRFPVHDRRRCNNWLKFFNITPEFVKKHGLQNLRVCLKHFHQQNQMAKTRMKTTPTRLQKDGLTAEDIKKRLRQVNSTQPKKEVLQVTSSVLVTPPKRTNSISSATSSVSVVSDAHSGHSDNEFVAVNNNTTKTATITTAKTTTTSKTPMIVTNRSTPPTSLLLNKQPAPNRQGNLVKNRKIFMITEKSDELDKESDASMTNQNQTSSGQKRKMYLIMEESPEQSATSSDDSAGDTIKNEFTGNATKKKLTLYTDKCDAQLTQKFEQILPEILSRINSKVKDQREQNATPATTAIGASPTIAAKQNGHSIGRAVPPPSTTDRSPALIQSEPTKEPITLPPKKNRMKIINTAVLPTPTQSISAATPVIVSASQLLNSNTKLTMENKSLVGNIVPLPTQQKNINLSADFLFLMKMLPKLEAIPEPHKNHVKNCIEKIVTQNAALFHE